MAFLTAICGGQVADLLGVGGDEYTASHKTCDFRRLRLRELIFRLPKTQRYFLTPYGWKIARRFVEPRGCEA